MRKKSLTFLRRHHRLYGHPRPGIHCIHLIKINQFIILNNQPINHFK